jgi:tRNA threonylcarbamoyl adenosine modification protein YeaZ
VVVGVGPGPFTGLRVGIVTARVLGEALSVPVHGVCSLDVVAAGAVADGRVSEAFTVVTDARRKEVYAAAYDAVGARLGAPYVGRAIDLAAHVRHGPVVGVGALLHPDDFTAVRSVEPLAGASLASVSFAVAQGRRQPLDTTPMYLRRPDAVASTGRKRVTPS